MFFWLLNRFVLSIMVVAIVSSRNVLVLVWVFAVVRCETKIMLLIVVIMSVSVKTIIWMSLMLMFVCWVVSAFLLIV